MIKYLTVALLLTASAAHAEIYTWRAGATDFYTNSLDEIPARYLKKARVLVVATGKKGALATELPVSPPGTAAPALGMAPSSTTTSAAGSASTAVTSTPAPQPVATTAPPASPVPEITAPQYRSREARIKQRSRRRGPDPAAED